MTERDSHEKPDADISLQSFGKFRALFVWFYVSGWHRSSWPLVGQITDNRFTHLQNPHCLTHPKSSSVLSPREKRSGWSFKKGSAELHASMLHGKLISGLEPLL